MLSGKRAFSGATTPDVLEAVVKKRTGLVEASRADLRSDPATSTPLPVQGPQAAPASHRRGSDCLVESGQAREPCRERRRIIRPHRSRRICGGFGPTRCSLGARLSRRRSAQGLSRQTGFGYEQVFRVRLTPQTPLKSSTRETITRPLSAGRCHVC
jgi:hypothetical protein